MKLRAQVLQVKEREGKRKDGTAWKMLTAAITLFDATGNFFGMFDGTLPDALGNLRPGLYDGEFSFEYATDIRAFRPRIESLVPVKG